MGTFQLMLVFIAAVMMGATSSHTWTAKDEAFARTRLKSGNLGQVVVSESHQGSTDTHLREGIGGSLKGSYTSGVHTVRVSQQGSSTVDSSDQSNELRAARKGNILQGLEIENELQAQGNLAPFLTEMKDAVTQLIESHNQLLEGHNQLVQQYEDAVGEIFKLKDLAKIGILRTCAEYADFGLKSSGPFLIDPDGPLTGKAPFEVFCNFTSGSTDVLQTANNLTPVGHCSEEGCFEKNVTYISQSTNKEVPATQIAALMQLSEYCVQGFYYECTLAPLRDGQANFAYWTDRHGEKNVYFTGGNKGFHSCDCHFTNEGCFMEETRGNTCNCDASLPAPLVDTGLLTNMSALPVTKLAFGGLSYSIQKASFKLGNLQCYGKIQPEPASSCSALKVKGLTRSGYYEIKKPGDFSTTLVFCDMAADGYVNVPQIEQKRCPDLWKEFYWNGLETYCYRLFTSKKNWSSARDHCLSLDADLASIESSQEQDFVHSLISSDTWIGANDKRVEGVWEWSDGRAFVYQNWIQGQPDGGTSQFAAYMESSNGQWRDNTDSARDFICKL